MPKTRQQMIDHLVFRRFGYPSFKPEDVVWPWADAPQRAELAASLQRQTDAELLAQIEKSEAARTPLQQAQFMIAEIFPFADVVSKTSIRRGAISVYQAKLLAMTEGERAAHRAAVLRGNGPSLEELDEAARWFNLPSVAANFQRWAKEPLWTVDEAVALSLGRDPESVTWDEIKAYSTSSFVAEFARRRGRMARAIAAGDMKLNNGAMRPHLFLEWGRAWDVPFPDELRMAVPFLENQSAFSRPAGAQETQTPEPRLPPMTPAQLSDWFVCPLRDHGKHGDRAGWRRICSEAKQRELLHARVSEGKGSAPATFDPELVAKWIVARDDALEYRTATDLIKLIDKQDDPDAYKAIRGRWSDKTAE